MAGEEHQLLLHDNKLSTHTITSAEFLLIGRNFLETDLKRCIVSLMIGFEEEISWRPRVGVKLEGLCYEGCGCFAGGKLVHDRS